MKNSDTDYKEAIQANIDVHSAMADDYNTIEPHFRKESIDRVKEIISELVKEHSIEKVLDLGCGTGFMINILKHHATEIKGVDVTQAMLDKVDTSGDCDIELVNSDTGSVELPDNYYDIATA
ncbi:methyltransferase domain-containing protein, partial [Salibacteraceae bacterium]|nr:methyltransferase domain-containing protein [Salibacteraceae bacterium]